MFRSSIFIKTCRVFQIFGSENLVLHYVNKKSCLSGALIILKIDW